MNPLSSQISRELFDSLTRDALATRRPGEHWVLALVAEGTQFLRFNAAKVRQSGVVQEADLSIKLIVEKKGREQSASKESDPGLSCCDGSITLEGSPAEMAAAIAAEMNRLRAEIATLPPDPYATPPASAETSHSVRRAELLSPEFAARTLAEGMAGADLAGIYAAGTMVRATASSTGSRHWFETDTFSFDYSLYTPAQKALKSLHAGQDWDNEGYVRRMARDREQLLALEREPRAVPRGTYRTYLAPAAVAELVGMLAYGTFSEGAIRQNKSPLRLLRLGEASLSPLLTLAEDFSGGEVPRFNDEGELAPLTLDLVRDGKLVNTLVSTRSAAEYGVPSNGAVSSEALRSPRVAPGDLKESEILARLGTGLYLSNLHYLNWSDVFKGRITGMTRYACFWVENGKIAAPIKDLRFDDTIFRILGSELEALTETPSLIPEMGTYEYRQLGAMRVPGALIRGMEFTL